MADDKSTTQALREQFAPDRIEGKLQEVVEERPKARFLLDFAIVAKAVLAAVVVAAVLWLIFNPQLAGIALVVVFLGAWFGMAQLSYDKRRETRDTRDADPDASGYEGDRGEVEAEREQEGDEDRDEDGDQPASRNGSSPDHEPAGSSN